LQQVKVITFLDELVQFEVDQEIKKLLKLISTKYGMRCAGEIRYYEKPLERKTNYACPMILNNIKNFGLMPATEIDRATGSLKKNRIINDWRHYRMVNKKQRNKRRST